MALNLSECNNDMTFKQKLSYCENWNIGFVQYSPEEFVNNKSLLEIKWLQHPYKDRWFADPFIYKVSASEIIVFVEEYPFETNIGRLVELVVDRKSFRLINRYLLLEQESHLSYPSIVRKDNNVYVFPENVATGQFSAYLYDEKSHSLLFYKNIIKEPLADATIVQIAEGMENLYLMTALKSPDVYKNLNLYFSKELFGDYSLYQQSPVSTSSEYSRPAGNWIKVKESWYRPAQDCSKRYGGGISIMRVLSFPTKQQNEEYKEELAFKLEPQKGRYGFGIHTINFCDGFCVVDGYGWLYPTLGPLYNKVRNIWNRNY